MSLTVNAAATTLPTLNLRGHGHKKGVHADTGNDSIGASTGSSAGSSSSSGEVPTSTQGLFSSLLQTVGQVVGIPAITALGNTSATASSGVAANSQSPSALGRNLNALA
jgi:hypothetical protein